MVQFTNVEKTEFLLIYGECNRNARLACRVYSQRFPGMRCPDHKTLKALVNNLQRHGSFTKPKRDKNRPVRNNINRNNVIGAVIENPQSSIELISETTNFTSTSVRRILTENGHNMHYWSNINSRWTRHRNFQVRFKVNVWAGILGGRLIGPHFFENNLNVQIYLNFLQNELPIYLEDVPLKERRDIWFYQDGAAPHNARIISDYLNAVFRNQWIDNAGPIRWPVRSPDLNPLDYYLWGYLKNFVYETQPLDIEDLKNRIRNGFNSIRRNIGEKI